MQNFYSIENQILSRMVAPDVIMKENSNLEVKLKNIRIFYENEKKQGEELQQIKSQNDIAAELKELLQETIEILKCPVDENILATKYVALAEALVSSGKKLSNDEMEVFVKLQDYCIEKNLVIPKLPFENVAVDAAACTEKNDDSNKKSWNKNLQLLGEAVQRNVQNWNTLDLSCAEAPVTHAESVYKINATPTKESTSWEEAECFLNEVTSWRIPRPISPIKELSKELEEVALCRELKKMKIGVHGKRNRQTATNLLTKRNLQASKPPKEIQEIQSIVKQIKRDLPPATVLHQAAPIRKGANQYAIVGNRSGPSYAVSTEFGKKNIGILGEIENRSQIYKDRPMPSHGSLREARITNFKKLDTRKNSIQENSGPAKKPKKIETLDLQSFRKDCNSLFDLKEKNKQSNAMNVMPQVQKKKKQKNSTKKIIRL